MPNLVLVSNAKFRPFSFDEMLKPALMATQAHQAVEEAYSELDTQANAIGSLASETDDPKAYAMYKAYENSLRAQAEDLAANGLNAASRQAMLNMRSRYAKEITPIQNAIERRRKLADAQMEAYMKNPTLMFQRNFNTKSWETSLDRFLEDPDYGYGDMASGALITQQAATQAGALAKKLNSIGKGKLDNYTSTFIQHYGLSPADIAAFNADPKDPKANKVLRAIYDNVYNTVPESIRNQYADDVNSYIGMGLYSAIGEDKLQTYENYGARLAAQEASKKRLMDYENSLKNNNPTLPIDPVRIGVGGRTSASKSDLQSKLESLGIRAANGQSTASKSLSIGYGKKTEGRMMPGMTSGGRSSINQAQSRFNLFVESQGGRLKTKAELLSQAKSNEEKKALGDYYDKYVTPIVKDYFGGKTASVSRADLLNLSNLESNRAASEHSPTYALGYNFKIADDITDLMKKTSNVGTKAVWEIEPASDNSTWTSTKKAGSLNSVLKSLKDNNKSAETYLVTQNGKTGLLINSEDKQYFLNFNDISSNLSQTTQYYIQQQQDAANKYYQALSNRNNKEANDYYNSASNWQQAALRTAGQTLSLEYDIEPYKLNKD